MFKFGDLVRVKYGTSPINNFNGEAILEDSQIYLVSTY